MITVLIKPDDQEQAEIDRLMDEEQARERGEKVCEQIPPKLPMSWKLAQLAALFL